MVTQVLPTPRIGTQDLIVTAVVAGTTPLLFVTLRPNSVHFPESGPRCNPTKRNSTPHTKNIQLTLHATRIGQFIKIPSSGSKFHKNKPIFRVRVMFSMNSFFLFCSYPSIFKCQNFCCYSFRSCHFH